MDSSEETQLKLKQETIKLEIIDKNYDKDKFLEFCISKKEGGDDLNKWTILELNEVIEEFVKEEDKQHQSPQPQTEKQEKKVEEKPTANVNTIENMNIIHQDDSKLGAFEKEIICKKLEKTVLNDKEVTVIIRNPKIIDATILQSAYITYEVVTENQGWMVRRRFSDFEWLRSVLCKCFNRFYVKYIFKII